MLNLFKLPFRARKDTFEKNEPAENLAVGILGNLLRRKKDISPVDVDGAFDSTFQEMQALQKHLQEPKADRYDLMSKALRKMDKDLDKRT